MNYTREDLLQSDATMNQMRNAIYQLQRLLKLNSITEIKEILRRMGRNIAHTYFQYWKPIEYVDTSNVKDVIATLYRNILNSSVSIETDEISKKIQIKDTDCPLCKYHFENIEVAGCEVIVAMIAEFILLINKKLGEKTPFIIKSLVVEESKALGHNFCIHNYEYQQGGA
jgi:preprotein translocase subunit SecA